MIYSLTSHFPLACGCSTFSPSKDSTKITRIALVVLGLLYKARGEDFFLETYNGLGYADSRALAHNSRGDIFVVGNTGGVIRDPEYGNGYYPTSSEAFIVKRGAEESSSLAKTFKNEERGVNALAIDGSNNIYVARGSDNDPNVMAKLDAKCSITWVKTFDSYVRSIDVDKNGNLLIVGNSPSHGSFVGMWDGEGLFQWADAVGNGHNFYDIDFGKQETIVGAGSIWTDAGDEFALIAEWDLNGTRVWGESLRFGGYHSLFSDCVTDTKGAIVAAGEVYDDDGYFNGALLVKFKPDRTVSWVKIDGSEESTSFNAVAIDKEGAIFAAGYISDYALLGKLNSLGGIVWVKKIGDKEDSLWDSTDLALDTEGNIILLGSVGSRGPWGSFLLRTNTEGAKPNCLSDDTVYTQIYFGMSSSSISRSSLGPADRRNMSDFIPLSDMSLSTIDGWEPERCADSSTDVISWIIGGSVAGGCLLLCGMAGVAYFVGGRLKRCADVSTTKSPIDDLTATSSPDTFELKPSS